MTSAGVNPEALQARLFCSCKEAELYYQRLGAGFIDGKPVENVKKKVIPVRIRTIYQVSVANQHHRCLACDCKKTVREHFLNKDIKVSTREGNDCIVAWYIPAILSIFTPHSHLSWRATLSTAKSSTNRLLYVTVVCDRARRSLWAATFPTPRAHLASSAYIASSYSLISFMLSTMAKLLARSSSSQLIRQHL